MDKKIFEETLSLIQEAINYQMEYAEILEDALGKSAYDHWIFERFFASGENRYFPEQRGQNKDESVRWFFHGLEVDVKDVEKNLKIRIEFGPAGALNCFTESSIERYIENTCVSSKYTKIRSYLNEQKRGDYWGIAKILEHLLKNNLINYIEPSLVQLAKKYTIEDRDGNMSISIPTELLPEDKSRLMFCEHYILNPNMG